MSVRIGILLSVIFLAACGGSSGKDAGPRKDKQGATDCSDKKDPDIAKKSSGSSTDPWGEPLQLVQDKVDFTQVKPFLTQSCLSCHAGYDTAPIAQQKADLFIARMDMDPTAAEFMPKGAAKISLENRSLFMGWKYSGFPETAADVEDEDVLGEDTIKDGDEWLNDDC